MVEPLLRFNKLLVMLKIPFVIVKALVTFKAEEIVAEVPPLDLLKVKV